MTVVTASARAARFFLHLIVTLLAASTAFPRPNFNIDSLSYRLISGTRGCWGYVDSSGKEYALICAGSRLEIWDIAQPDSPKFVRSVPREGSSDLKQVRPYKNFAVAVNQSGGAKRAGLQIINMGIPEAATTVAVWPDTTDLFSPNGAHTVHIDSHYAYLGMNGAGDHWRIIDLSNPINPVQVPGGTYLSPYGGQSHDSYVKGDTAYVAFLDGGFSIVDITNRSAPKKIADVGYPGAFTHNCWPTEDGKYIFTTDEIPGTGHLRVWDVRDPENPAQVAEWMPPGRPSIIHNVQVKGNFLYAAYYADGVVILDIEDPTQPVEVGHYDTTPKDSGSSFTGCWDFFPYFPSGTLLASNLSSPLGMWLLRFNEAKAGRLSGRVVDWETGDSLSEVTVGFVGLFRQTKTDSSGNYLARTEGGTVQLTFSKDGFRPETVTVEAALDSAREVPTVRLISFTVIPGVPQNLEANPDNLGNIYLFWETPPDSDLAGFRLYRATVPDSNNFLLLDSPGPQETTHVDAGSTPGERYLYRIQSVDTQGFASPLSVKVRSMRYLFGSKILLVDRTAYCFPNLRNAFAARDSLARFHARLLRRFDFDSLRMDDCLLTLPNVNPAFVTQHPVIVVHSSEFQINPQNDNPAFLSFFNDYLRLGGKLIVAGHWPILTANSIFLCNFEPIFLSSVDAATWNVTRSLFGFDCLFSPALYPLDTTLYSQSFLFARPKNPAYPTLIPDSNRVNRFVHTGGRPAYPYPTLPNVGYLTSLDSTENLYSFGSILGGSDEKNDSTVAKKHIDSTTGGGFVWFNFPLFFVKEDSAKKAFHQALTDLGVQENFPKGDLDRDGIRDLSDVIVLLDWVFLGQPFEIFDASEADMNCDGQTSPSDIVLLLLNVFPGQPLPCN